MVLLSMLYLAAVDPPQTPLPHTGAQESTKGKRGPYWVIGAVAVVAIVASGIVVAFRCRSTIIAKWTGQGASGDVESGTDRTSDTAGQATSDDESSERDVREGASLLGPRAQSTNADGRSAVLAGETTTLVNSSEDVSDVGLGNSWLPAPPLVIPSVRGPAPSVAIDGSHVSPGCPNTAHTNTDRANTADINSAFASVKYRREEEVVAIVNEVVPRQPSDARDSPPPDDTRALAPPPPHTAAPVHSDRLALSSHLSTVAQADRQPFPLPSHSARPPHPGGQSLSAPTNTIAQADKQALPAHLNAPAYPDRQGLPSHLNAVAQADRQAGQTLDGPSSGTGGVNMSHGAPTRARSADSPFPRDEAGTLDPATGAPRQPRAPCHRSSLMVSGSGSFRPITSGSGYLSSETVGGRDELRSQELARPGSPFDGFRSDNSANPPLSPEGVQGAVGVAPGESRPPGTGSVEGPGCSRAARSVRRDHLAASVDLLIQGNRREDSSMTNAGQAAATGLTGVPGAAGPVGAGSGVPGAPRARTPGRRSSPRHGHRSRSPESRAGTNRSPTRDDGQEAATKWRLSLSPIPEERPEAEDSSNINLSGSGEGGRAILPRTHRSQRSYKPLQDPHNTAGILVLPQLPSTRDL